MAKASGLLTTVPATPPAVSVRPTSGRALVDVVVVSVLAFAGLAVVINVAVPRGWGGVAVLLASCALGFWVIGRALRRWGFALMAELRHGYTTSPPGLTMASWWIGWPGHAHGVGWDWGALWVLHGDGRVRSAPTGPGLPPGPYPSPRRAGALELWTGCQWTGYFPPDHT